MKIIIEEPGKGEEELIILKCHQISPKQMQLLNAFKSGDNVLIGYQDNTIQRVREEEIYYIEAVDNKVFLYCENSVMESKQKLYELEALLGTRDFLRISKSTIINMSKIKRLAPAFSGRLEASLINGEKIIISRQYVSGLKKILGI